MVTAVRIGSGRKSHFPIRSITLLRILFLYISFVALAEMVGTLSCSAGSERFISEM